MNAPDPANPPQLHPPAYPLPPDEPARLQAVAATGLIDSPAETSYDDIVAIAARICNTPIALVTVVGEDRQYFKAKVGVDIQGTPRSLAFCNYPVADRRLCIVPDAASDPRFSNNILVSGDPHIRFYAGAPLITPDGHALGTLCVIDVVPHQLSHDQINALEALARQVVREINMRRQLRDLHHLIHQRDEAQRALAASEERLQYALDATDEGVWDWDLTTGDCFYSPRCFKMLGYTVGELPHRIDVWKTICHPDDLPQGMERLERHWKGQTPNYEFEHRLRRDDGRYMWILSRGAVVKRAPDGTPLRMVGTIWDVSRRKQEEAELRRAKEDAQAASAAKSQFLANMSHEIRTPMTAILGFSELLLDRSLPPAQQQQYVETIRRNSRNLLTLINDILDLSKIEANKIQVERIRCVPAQLIFEVAGLIRDRVAKKDLRFAVEHLTPIPDAIYADPTRLRQILTNLLGNAVKFTEKGAITLRVGVQHAPEPRLHFEVLDTGIGMAPEQLPSLFQPFQQADPSTTRRFGGTGLGLSISHRLAQLLGGELSATSRPGHGSSFTFWIPLHICTEEPPSPPQSPLAIAASTKPLHASILVVEDGPDNQTLLRFLLERAGAAVTLADNGRIAVDKAIDALRRGQPFDLILMDMQMPELDGYSATRILRDLNITTPIVALTANVMDGDRERCLAAGCSDFAGKPIDAADLLRTLRRNLHHDSP